MKYIVVQAGGKGSRMERLTANKPKALVPIDNLPMIFHLFRKFPESKYIIIGDYKFDVLKNYLREFAEVDYELVCCTGHKGTCSGISEAIKYIPENERFMLIWCDLVLPDDYSVPESKNNIIGLSKDFPCRWKYEGDVFCEERSSEFGVAGHFIFQNKSFLEDVPSDGELVRWFQSKNYVFEEQPLYKTHEYGLIEEWNKLEKPKCRPFNRVEIRDGKFYKTPIDAQGEALAKREAAWYRKISEYKTVNLPEIYSYTPLCMEFIDGRNVYEYDSITYEEKKSILKQIVGCLQAIHELETVPADKTSYRVAYLDKTYDRLKKVRHLVPFADDETIVINGRNCRNVFYNIDEINARVMSYCPSEFRLIHGDCTFSNIMLRKDMTPVLIDPRGYFGNTELYGDVAYDWAKLYYSLFSNYDRFNIKHFDLQITESQVLLEIESNHWEDMEEEFFSLLEGQVTKEQMKLFLSIIWLSLTTYAWEDYDSICGAFYMGIYLLEEALK
ncbi:MAG: NTP transferase domain-containing protein [Lachnospiraceae bacterium]|nr:NTP transferase domain-containing protein [Lachnospiraceae bacterium]